MTDEMTLDEWAQMCWGLVAVRSLTLKDYQGKWGKHVSPVLGSKPLRGVTRADVQRLILSLPPAVQKSTLPIIKTVFREARNHEYLPTGHALPSDGIKKQAHTPLKREFLVWDKVQALDFGPHTGLFRFLARHGLRWSEAINLTEEDIIRNGDRLYVRVTKSREGATKSARSRDIPMMPDAPWQPGWPTNYSFARKRFAKVTEAAYGQPYQIHSLRKTFAYTAKTKGVHPQVAQRLLGHSTIELTFALYTEVLPSEIDEAADLMLL